MPILIENSHKISLEICTERTIRKTSNKGNVLFFVNNLDISKKNWKNKAIKKILFEKLQKIKNRVLDKIRVDARDLCIKRGKVFKNLKFKIHFEKKLNFKLLDFFYKIPFSLVNKHLVIKNNVKYPKKYLEVFHDKNLKNLPGIFELSSEIYKKKYYKLQNTKKSRKFVTYFNNSKFKTNILAFFLDQFDKEILKTFLIFYIYKWCCKKKGNFLII
jgi:hypothetical protein